MKENIPPSKEVDDFIRNEIDTVPHLEALLLVWNGRPRQWTEEEMAAQLYVDPAVARNILQALVRRGLLAIEQGTPERYRYQSISPKQDGLIKAVDVVYRKELIRISRMIHSQAPAVRDFAKAFRFTKDR